jgi:four helix bundle protein
METLGIAERTVAYSLRVVRLYRAIERDGVGRILGAQLLRCATSIGANVHEAQGAQSKPDFIAKMSIAHKEAYETGYWLRLITEAKLVDHNQIAELIDETQQVIKIISKILITAKSKKRPSK